MAQLQFCPIDSGGSSLLLCSQETVREIHIPHVVRIESAQDFYTDPVFWVSVSSVLISVFAIVVAIQQSRRQRSQSVTDDYWFRTVLHDTSTQPLLEFFQWARTRVPDAAAAKSEVDRAMDELRKQVEEVEDSIVMIGLIANEAMLNRVRAFIEDVEDSFSEHCGNLAAGAPSDPVAVRDAISHASQGFVVALKRFQSGL